MRVHFLMKDDYDVVSAEIGAWLHCCVTGSRLFAAKLLLIVILPLWVESTSSPDRKAAIRGSRRLNGSLLAVNCPSQDDWPMTGLAEQCEFAPCLVRLLKSLTRRRNSVTVNVSLWGRLVPINSMRLGSYRKMITQQLPLNALMGVSAF